MTNVTFRLEDQLHEALRRNPYLTRRKLHLETSDGRVVLRGAVNSYYQKQMAQETLRRVPGVEQIENQLEVLWG
jgi:osmotically-inducible protein OsmY